MSIILKGINMPKSCNECKFESAQYVNNYCRRAFCSLGADYEHYPLVEIPTPHGRLIDEQKILLTNFEIFMCEGSYKDALKLICEKLDDAPTILEAEE